MALLVRGRKGTRATAFEAAGIPPPSGPVLLYGRTLLGPGDYRLFAAGDPRLVAHFRVSKDPAVPVRIYCHHQGRDLTFRDRMTAFSQKGEILATVSTLRFGACCRSDSTPVRPIQYPAPIWVLVRPVDRPQKFWLEGTPITIRPDQYLLLDPSERLPFARIPPTPTHMRVIWFMPPAFRGLWHSVRMPYPMDVVRFPLGPHATDRGLESALMQMEEALQDVGVPAAGAAAEIACYSVLLALLKRHPPRLAPALPRPARSAQMDRRLKLAIEYIETYHADPYSARNLARHACASVEVLWKLFRKHLGETPVRFLQRVRVARAKELLRDPELTVAEIAGRVGYRDVRSFRRIFLTHAEKPLGSFRNV